MPSAARKAFTENLNDIDLLIDYYQAAQALYDDDPKEPLPKGADVVLRSAIVMIVTYWESYVEDIVSEALRHIVNEVDDPNKLPKNLKKLIAKELHADKNELAAWKLCGDGWREVVMNRLPDLKESRDRRFNTPKTVQTKEFVASALGIPDITAAWKIDDKSPAKTGEYLDRLVAVRGKIAHRGKLKTKVTIKTVKHFQEFAKKLVTKTGGRINTEVRKMAGSGLW